MIEFIKGDVVRRSKEYRIRLCDHLLNSDANGNGIVTGDRTFDGMRIYVKWSDNSSTNLNPNDLRLVRRPE